MWSLTDLVCCTVTDSDCHHLNSAALVTIDSPARHATAVLVGGLSGHRIFEAIVHQTQLVMTQQQQQERSATWHTLSPGQSRGSVHATSPPNRLNKW